ncbi:MAG: MarR family transcriptional regulator [Lapillicoccus sp.]
MTEPNTGVLMFVAYRAMEERILAAVHAAGFTDVTLAQARVFARIGPEGTRLTDLAAQAQVTKQSAGHLVDEMEARGYVTREPDPSDGRARLVTFGPRGREAIPVAMAAEREVEAEWAAHLGPRRAAQLRAALVSLREVTDPWRDPT